ncbi:hypothetical protein NQ317_004643 [Molorchus minor]|uniref:Uncharacterized protein n=1 Tax=Molorchus minor TaxID=1323400 RepID=A0ABQ9JB74_9CUCU|nr:hypothetical protein NQ317_004643 [Molorchus minor]
MKKYSNTELVVMRPLNVNGATRVTFVYGYESHMGRAGENFFYKASETLLVSGPARYTKSNKSYSATPSTCVQFLVNSLRYDNIISEGVSKYFFRRFKEHLQHASNDNSTFDSVMTKRRKRHSQYFTGEINDPDFVL